MYCIKRSHYGTRSCIDRRTVGLQVFVEHMVVIRIDIVIFATGFHQTV